MIVTVDKNSGFCWVVGSSPPGVTKIGFLEAYGIIVFLFDFAGGTHFLRIFVSW